MSRRRYLSTDISTDARVAELALTAGDFAVSLYMMLIPHAEDSAEVVGSATEILYRVVPARRDKTPEDIDEALAAMQALGLLVWDGRRVSFPPDAFYRHQTYVKPERRRSEHPTPPPNGNSPRNSAQRRTSPQIQEVPGTTPQIPASVSLSVSVSPSIREGSKSKPPRARTTRAASEPPRFAEFYEAYPRHMARGDAAKAWQQRIKGGADPDALIAGAMRMAEFIDAGGQDRDFVPYPATWLRAQRELDELHMPHARAGPGRNGLSAVDGFMDLVNQHEEVTRDATGVGTAGQEARSSLPGAS